MISRCDGKYVYLYKNVWAYPSQKTAFIHEETTHVSRHDYCNLASTLKKIFVIANTTIAINVLKIGIKVKIIIYVRNVLLITRLY